MPAWLLFLLIGTAGGIAAGLFGIGGGILVVPALVYLAGFSQQLATGTSLAMLLPPIGLVAAAEYYRHGNVDVRAAVLLAASMFVGSWFGAHLANRLAGPLLALAFGVFVCVVGVAIVVHAARRLGWL